LILFHCVLCAFESLLFCVIELHLRHLCIQHQSDITHRKPLH